MDFWAEDFWAPGFWQTGFWALALNPDAQVHVTATGDGYFAGFARHEGDILTLTDPRQWSPYWMELIDTPPADWLPIMRTFDPVIDRAILKAQPELVNVPDDFAELLS